MEMTGNEKIMAGLREEVVKKIDEYNEAFKANDLKRTSQIEEELREAEATYAEAKQNDVFSVCRNSESPMLEAIRTHSYYVVSHRPVREDGVVRGFELVENKVRQLDLVKFCKFCSMSTLWQYSVEKFNQLLAIRSAKELKMTKAQIDQICTSFYMNKVARALDMGETPDSNTAIGKLLQKVLDEILFVDNGKGKNVYQINSRDVAYLLMCYTKRGKKGLSVAVSKNVYMHRLIADVAHRIVTGKVYDLEYRISKPEDDAEVKKEVKAKKAKTDAVEVETVVVEKSA